MPLIIVASAFVYVWLCGSKIQSVCGVNCSAAYLLNTDVFCIVMLCCCIFPDILKDHSTFIVSVELSEWNDGSSWAT